VKILICHTYLSLFRWDILQHNTVPRVFRPTFGGIVCRTAPASRARIVAIDYTLTRPFSTRRGFHCSIFVRLILAFVGRTSAIAATELLRPLLYAADAEPRPASCLDGRMRLPYYITLAQYILRYTAERLVNIYH
jgi:hypothetical protein